MGETPTPLPPPAPEPYDPAATERAADALWERTDAFTAHAERTTRGGGDRPPFVIVMPPPNVTAVLHMGQGLNNTVQDVIIRWRRMAGDEALWLPGTDHAGIATQNVVERLIGQAGKTRFDLGRDAFVARTAAFVEDTRGTILRQLRAIGASCDWTRTSYTLSPALSRAVRESFVRLYEQGLIYRGHRVIHWCSRCLTSLSDEEAEHADAPGHLYHIRYPLVEPRGALTSLVVATTRPETMLGDVAVAVHPDDERYASAVGARVRLPIAGALIPVIADTYVDPAFGTGAVKITPAHDANDFDVGKRHGLAMPVVMTPDGRMGDGTDSTGRVPAELRGMDRFEARERIVAMLAEQGMLVKKEPHQHAVRRCYRCDTVVEPRLSDQWFVKMQPLAQPALEAIRTGALRILPERWEAVYINWLENIRDWNISRQIWWGHRIPVWYCEGCAEITVSRDDIAACPKCGKAVRQDDDVLDTWFSSWLWPFSTLGWPDDTPDLRAFYPTDVLVTAPEILFFWVARMIMGGYALVPRPGEPVDLVKHRAFHTVYLHGTVRDTTHMKMSKSLGNGIDPLDVVKLYGADALRYTVIAGMGMGADLILDPRDLEASFATGRNFVTKLRNIGRFLITAVGDATPAAIAEIAPERLTLADRWILDRLDVAIADCNAALGPARPDDRTWRPDQLRMGLRLNEYAESARRFVWSELADWYVESTKARLAQPGPDADVARTLLVHAFDAGLRLLHPIVPFITEELWGRLPMRRETPSLARAAWPLARGGVSDAANFEVVRETVSALRQMRSDYAISPANILEAFLVVGPATGAPSRAVAETEGTLIGHLARCTVRVVTESPGGAAAHHLLKGGLEVVLPLAGIVDLDRECARLRRDLDELDRQIESLGQRLANEKFIARAPAAVVEAERAKALEWAGRREQLAHKVSALCGG